MVVDGHTYVTGGNSDDEHFGPAHALDAERSNVNCETCNTYNMLKLTLELFALTGDVKYAHYYENAFINAILASQNPETGMTMYFQPMATGYFKVFSSEFDHFWCCTGTGTENFTKLGEGLYLPREAALFVNGYLSSTFEWESMGVRIEQASELPEGDGVRLTVRGSARFELRLRVPDWISGPIEARLNGEPVEVRPVAGYFSIERSWSDGDELELRLPMAVVARKLPDGDAWAFRYGPYVLSAALGADGMTALPHGVQVLKAGPPASVDDVIRVDEGYGSVAEWLCNAAENFERQGTPPAFTDLAFTLKNTDRALVFTPHFRQFRERYGIYWRFRGRR
jgi:DUF1680 family protein